MTNRKRNEAEQALYDEIDKLCDAARSCARERKDTLEQIVSLSLQQVEAQAVSLVRRVVELREREEALTREIVSSRDRYRAMRGGPDGTVF